MSTRTLTTKATDNHGYSYDVVLTETEHPRFVKKDWVLHIKSTPGQWYMTTLEENPNRGSIISIDFGQNWNCTNFDVLMVEAQALLASIDRLTAAEVKTSDDALWVNLAR